MARSLSPPIDRPPLEAVLDAGSLLELISILNLPLESQEFLRRVVELCTRAVSCRSGFIYLWDPHSERLVVRAATQVRRQFEHRIALELGEGIVGWAALNRQPVVLAESATQDPRFKLIPELEEDKFQSCIVVPIIGRDDELVGGIIVRTEARHEFTASDVALVAGIASLVGGAIQNLRMHDRMRRQLKIFDAVTKMSETVSSDRSLVNVLNTVSHLIVESFEVDLAAVFLSRSSRNEVVLRTFASRPDVRFVEQRAHSTVCDALAGLAVEEIRTLRKTDLPDLFTLFTLEGGEIFESAIVAPLVVRKRRLGFLVCYSRDPLFLVDVEMLGAAVSQAASAIFNAELVEAASSSRSRRFLQRLLDLPQVGERHEVVRMAEELGCNLRRAYCVLVVRAELGEQPGRARPRRSANGERPASDIDSLLDRMHDAIRRAHPDSVVDHDSRTLRALVPVPAGGPAAIARSVGETARSLSGEGVILRGGVSDPRSGLEELRLAGIEAEETLEAGGALGARRTLWAREEIGAYRYLNRLAIETPADEMQKRIAALLDRDAERSSQLFRSLEVYLDNLGNLTEAARQLYVHRNTLKLRLEKVAELLGVDPTEPQHALTVHIALKLVRLRQIRASAPASLS